MLDIPIFHFRLHFRPKTPPLDYEPPCHLLPPEESPFANDALPAFHMEIEPLEPPCSTLLLDQSPFVTDLFELDRRWPEEDTASTLGPQGPIFEDDSYHQEEQEEDEDGDDTSWRTVGVSSFTLTDAGGEALLSRGVFVADEVSGLEDKSCGSKEGCGESQEVGSTNGLISQIGFAADGKLYINF